MTEKRELGKGEKVVRIVGGILGVFFLIILVIIKLNSPSFKIGTFIIVSILVILFFIGVIIAYHFWSKRAKPAISEKINSSLPKAITLEQAREIVSQQLKSPVFSDYHCGFISENNELLGKNIKSYVYSCQVKGVYENEIYTIIMNRSFPNETFNLLINATPSQIARVKNNAAFMPEDSPSIEETKIDDPLTGRTVTTRKEIHVSESEKDAKKKEDI